MKSRLAEQMPCLLTPLGAGKRLRAVFERRPTVGHWCRPCQILMFLSILVRKIFVRRHAVVLS